MKKRWTWAIWLVLALVFVSGCAAKQAATPQDSVKRAEAEAPQSAAPDARQSDGRGATYYGEGAVEGLSERMIISTVNMVLLVEDTDITVQELEHLAATYKGYISESRRWYVNEQPRATLTLRIPAGTLPEALDRIRALAVKVESENSSGEDVTEEYTDLAARLRNLEATEQELLVLLTEVRENRGKAEDILAIHRELTAIRGQIESTKGRQQYLERMSALATIHIEVRPKAAPATVIERVNWNPVVTASRALRALVDVVKVLIDLVIYVVILSPIFLVPAACIWLIIRLIRRRSKRQETPTTQ